MGINLELGTGMVATPGFIHHDKWKHSPHIDFAFDLEKLLWPVEEGSVTNLRAIDVFEHLKLEVHEWLGECWRVMEPGGMLVMRLPHYANPYSWRDPTHRRVFHPESFFYFCPDAPGTVFQNFGQYYWGEDYHKWWNWKGVEMEANDLKFTLRKPLTE
jgi:Methyltransferase domain